ncbi:MAG: hydrogenase iron-sulfur subunit, partial [Candidatus Thorarchaeota archaeon]
YNALKIENNSLNIIETNCTGCGACAAMCHSDALSIPGFTKSQIRAQMNILTKQKAEFPLIVAFLCNWCSYMGADLAGTSKILYPTNVRAIHVMCTAMLNPSLVFDAFFSGADGVLIAGCHPQDCHYDTGFIQASIRFESIKEMLIEAGINEKRIRIESISAGEGEKFAKVISEFKSQIEVLGPIKPGEFVKVIKPSEKEPKMKARIDEL